MKRKQGLFNYVILTLTGTMFEGIGRGPGGGANLKILLSDWSTFKCKDWIP